MGSAIAAFVHHVAAFALVAALTLQFALIREELTFRSARRLQVADAVLGVSALVVLAVGFLRVFYFEKGSAYYFHNGAFIAKISLFVLVALLSIYPTVTFLSWRPAMKEGRLPAVDLGKVRRVRAIIHWELAGALLIILCAALMARGIG
jgi:putative membrane protein